jgi:hypothetical protein
VIRLARRRGVGWPLATCSIVETRPTDKKLVIVGNKSYKAAPKTSEQMRAPTSSMASALGYDRLRILADRILADRIFADRIFADRGCRHRGRLPTGQVSGGRNAQHGK